MGSTGGHIVPGVFFLIYGCTWCLFSSWLYLTSSQSKSNARSSVIKTKFKTRRGGPSSSPSYESFKREMELSRKSYIPQPFCRNIPMEPIIKLLCSMMGIIVEVFFDMKDGKVVVSLVSFEQNGPKDGYIPNTGKLQHITMYSSFFLSGLIDLLALFLKVPHGTTKLFLTLAFINEGLLFFFHKETGQGDEFLYTVHLLLFIAIAVCGVCSFLRLKTPVNLLINSGLAFGMILQGTWFIQVGIIYHRQDQWKFSDYSNVMFVVALYAWHITIIWSAMFLTFLFSAAFIRSSICHRGKSRRQWLPPIPLLPMVAHDSEEGQQLISNEQSQIPPQLIETAAL